MSLTAEDISCQIFLGKRMSQIAKERGVSRQAIFCTLYRERKPKQHLRDAREAKAYWFRMQGLSDVEIGKRIGKHQAWISRMLSPFIELRDSRRKFSFIHEVVFRKCTYFDSSDGRYRMTVIVEKI